MTVQAVFENGVFRPVQPVAMPEKTLVEFEPRVVAGLPAPPPLDAIYDILDRRFNSGQSDVAERHNEHQP
ncbi:MAG TPA: antitoxin family protein [Pirellulaceae bacterium]|nr:antitoxin family protein [Pirellulaceae bacterium]